jgi:two-component system chemotaxis response regulator CheB
MADQLSILLVDDSRSVLAQLEGLLSDVDGVNVVGVARNGGEAIRMVSQLHPDLVLMDIVMPGMDGMAALRVIRTNHPGVQVAMLSSVGGTASRAEECFRLGAVQVIGKPLDERILESLIESVRAGLDARATE